MTLVKQTMQSVCLGETNIYGETHRGIGFIAYYVLNKIPFAPDMILSLAQLKPKPTTLHTLYCCDSSEPARSSSSSSSSKCSYIAIKGKARSFMVCMELPAKTLLSKQPAHFYDKSHANALRLKPTISACSYCQCL